jgi:hypothetical protein
MSIKEKSFSILLAVIACCAYADNFVLSKADTGKAAIVVSSVQCPSVNLASRELQHHIEQIIGLTLPIVTDEQALPYKKMLLVGESRQTKMAGIDISSFEPQEYLIKISSEKVILVGRDWQDTVKNRNEKGATTLYRKISDSRVKIDYGKTVGQDITDHVVLPGNFDEQGSCYAVYDFLERFCNVRWFGPDLKNFVIPGRSIVSFEPCIIKRSPDLKYRHSTRNWNDPMLKYQWFEPDPHRILLYLVRMRWGGEKWVGNHSFQNYYWRFTRDPKADDKQKEIFEAEKPEYFSVGFDTAGSWRHLCYTNPDVIEQVIKDARMYFDTGELMERGAGIGDYFCVVPNDGANWCKCEKCQEMMDKDKRLGEHFSNGIASRYVFNFVNQVAKEVYKTHPDKKISALAYSWYAFKPEMKLEPNITVAPCLQLRNYWAPGIRENEIRFYKQWVEARDRPVYLWVYNGFPTQKGVVFGFNVFPGFNMRDQSELIKMFVKDRVRGIFLCGFGEQFDFYASMKLYDDSTLSIDELIDDFFYKYFGNESGQYMKKFYTRIEQIYSSPESYPDEIRTAEKQFHQTQELAWGVLGTSERMQELGNYIENAYRFAENQIQRERIKSWDDGVWQYMLEGKRQYEQK